MYLLHHYEYHWSYIHGSFYTCSPSGHQVTLMWESGIKFQQMQSSTVQVKKTFPKTFTVQPLNIVPTAKRNSGNGKRRLTVRPLTVPFSARVCHAHFPLATRVHYPEVAKLVLTLHEPWQRPTAPKALKNQVDFYAIIRSRRGSYAPIAGCGERS